MPFEYKKLPFSSNSLEPFISERTMIYHHDKHYKKYVATLNELTAKSKTPNESLEATMIRSHQVDNAIFQNAAQAWNHEFYWKCLSPDKLKPSKKILEILEEKFGSVQEFKEAFNKAALSLFGSGWVWVVGNSQGELEIQALEKAENPLTSGLIPLLVCDVWEHAYYLDYQNDRAKYVNQFWEIINWTLFEENIAAAEVQNNRANQRGNHEIRAGF
jgi:Fe-Mn family superoxide dismutase